MVWSLIAVADEFCNVIIFQQYSLNFNTLFARYKGVKYKH